MATGQNEFLKAVLGPVGQHAILKAVANLPQLAPILLPRSVLGWLRAQQVVWEGQQDGVIPGTEMPYCLVKSEAGWTGSVGDYRFEHQTMFHLAGAVAVALGIDVDAMEAVESRDVERLGRSIDLLAKSRAVRHEAEKTKKVLKVEPQGGVAAPQGPKPPTAQEVPQKTQAAPKLPRPKKQPGLRIMKFETNKVCGVCSRPQFVGWAFRGCGCFAGLAKSVTVRPVGDQLHLEFGPDWGMDGILTLAETFGVK